MEKNKTHTWFKKYTMTLTKEGKEKYGFSTITWLEKIENVLNNFDYDEEHEKGFLYKKAFLIIDNESYNLMQIDNEKLKQISSITSAMAHENFKTGVEDIDEEQELPNKLRISQGYFLYLILTINEELSNRNFLEVGESLDLYVVNEIKDVKMEISISEHEIDTNSTFKSI